jgi:hypothetical protein
VAVTVVETLEVVDVEHDNRHRGGGRFADPKILDRLIELPAVGQARQRIPLGDLLSAFAPQLIAQARQENLPDVLLHPPVGHEAKIAGASNKRQPINLVTNGE